HVDLVVPDVLDLRLGQVGVLERAARSPLLVGHHQRPGHVLVGVGRGAAFGLPVHHRRVAARVDHPVHEAVAVRVELLVLPEVVEQRVIAHVDGDDHPVADPLGDGRIERRGPRGAAEPVGGRPLDALEAARPVGGDEVGLPLGVGSHDVVVVVGGRIGAARYLPVLRERKVGSVRGRRRPAREAARPADATRGAPRAAAPRAAAPGRTARAGADGRAGPVAAGLAAGASVRAAAAVAGVGARIDAAAAAELLAGDGAAAAPVHAGGARAAGGAARPAVGRVRQPAAGAVRALGPRRAGRRADPRAVADVAARAGRATGAAVLGIRLDTAAPTAHEAARAGAGTRRAGAAALADLAARPAVLVVALQVHAGGAALHLAGATGSSGPATRRRRARRQRRRGQAAD